MKWREMYDLWNNENRVEKLLRYYHIHKYHFVADGDTVALLIEINLNTYRIELDDYKEEMVIRKKTYRRREQKHAKEYMSIVKSYKNDCIKNSLEWIILDSMKI